MLKKIIVFFLSLYVFVTPALAANTATKYTFNNVIINNTVVEIEASVRTGKNPYSTCAYYSDNYISYLGSYNAAVVAGKDADTVETFCVNHFADRVL